MTADATSRPQRSRDGRALALRGIDKRFGPVHANRAVDLEVARGTVHAVVGENGAGKSTLMKIAFGQLRADAGEIELQGRPVPRTAHSPRRAMAAGVGMVHQHFMLVGPLRVVDNVILGREPRRPLVGWLPVVRLLDVDRAAAELAEVSARFGLDVDPWARIEDLSVGQQQRVEILKVLWRGSDLLILDEPTAVLTPAEVRDLFAVLSALVAEGMTVVLITHKLDEVVAIADRVTVMRRGEVVAELSGDQLSAEEIARAMVGRPVLLESLRTPSAAGEPVLEVSELEVADRRGGRPALRSVSLTVCAGEIVGVAGVEGNGQTELFEALSGLRRPIAGTIRIAGQDATGDRVADRARRGVAQVPEDRQRRGLILSYSVADNSILGQQAGFAGRWGLDRRRIGERARSLIADFDIQPATPSAPARALSGGNQQKLVVARELAREPLRLLLAAQPTRGVDIGAIEEIHRRIVAARDRGVAVLLSSAELSELRNLADRVVVLYRGRVVARLDRDALERPEAIERIGQLMTGAERAEGAL